MIPDAKIKALRQALERDGEVRFKNGSKVERVIETVDDPVLGGDRPAAVAEVHFLVTRPAGGRGRFADSEIHRAYEMALNGPRAKQQPSGDPSRFGDDPPW